MVEWRFVVPRTSTFEVWLFLEYFVHTTYYL